MGSFHDDEIDEDFNEMDDFEDFCDECGKFTKMSFIKINKNEKVLAVHRLAENSISSNEVEVITNGLDIVFGKGNYALIVLPFGHELELNIIEKGENTNEV